MLKELITKLRGKSYRKGIFIVVYKIKRKRKGDEIKYLILKRKLHWKGWEFPKGGKHPGESDFDAVKRELKEETGRKPISIMRYDKKGKYLYGDDVINDRDYIGQTYVLYSVQIKFTTIKLDKSEHSNYKWVDFDDAILNLTWPNQRKCLKIVNDRLTR